MVYTIITYRIFSVKDFCGIIESENRKAANEMTKKLIAFYSRADENYVSGTLKMLEVGNTEAAAEIIKELTGANMFKIEQSKPYSKGYNACIEEAKADQKANARPPLLKYPESIDEYDTIYLGFPNYWSTMPMAVFTFLEHFDFSGKVIKPFCTHEGSGMGRSVADIKAVCPNATVDDGLAILGSRVSKSKSNIEGWLKKYE